MPRIGRAIRLVKRVDEERSGKREEYENISHVVCCAPRRAGGVNGTKGVYREL